MTPPNLNLRLPYVTADLPGIGGVLRARVEDFVVEEMPLYLPSGTGTHLYVEITREHMSTREMVQLLEAGLGISRGGIGYAGLKDKDARSTQTISIPVNFAPDGALFQRTDDAVRRALADKGLVDLRVIGLHTNKLKVGHLKGNRFELLVSGITGDAVDTQQRVAAIATALRTQGVANFLGPQRFGAHGDNALAGYELLLGQRRERDKWLRRFLVTSCQSHLCNQYLAQRVERGLFGKLLPGDIAKKHDTGGIFTVEDTDLEQARYADQQISFTAPLFGYKMKRATGAAGALEAEIEAETGITDAMWRAAHSEGTRRMGRILLNDLEYAMHPRGVVMRFSLPKGAFATTAMREFMKGEGAELPAQEIDDETE